MMKESLRVQFQNIKDLFFIVFDTIKDNFSIAGIASLISTVIAVNISDAFTKVSEFIFEKFKLPITYFAMKIDEVVSIIKQQFYSLARTSSTWFQTSSRRREWKKMQTRLCRLNN